MSGTLFRTIFSSALSINKCNIPSLRSIHTGTVYYAARKGTRAKARAKKVKVEVTKVGFIPHNQRGKDRGTKVKTNRHQDDEWKQVSRDDVYPIKYYRWPVYSAEDAIALHKQTHDPSMYNVADALVYAQVEVNMEAVKKNRYLENITRLTLLPHSFPRDEERSILAFCKGHDLVKEAKDAGATVVGGTEIVKKFQEGQMKPADFDYIIAHPSIITDLVPIRGLLKRRFPTIRNGTLDPNVGALVRKFAQGIQYRVVKDEGQENFGMAVVPIGRLNMEADKVAENIAVLLKDLTSIRPKRQGLFITRCVITSPPSPEKLKIDPFVYIDRELSKAVQDDSDDEGDPVPVAATA